MGAGVRPEKGKARAVDPLKAMAQSLGVGADSTHAPDPLAAMAADLGVDTATTAGPPNYLGARPSATTGDIAPAPAPAPLRLGGVVASTPEQGVGRDFGDEPSEPMLSQVKRGVVNAGHVLGDVAQAAGGDPTNLETQAAARRVVGGAVEPFKQLGSALLAPGEGESKVNTASTIAGRDKDGNLIVRNNRTGLIQVIAKEHPVYDHESGAMTTAERVNAALPGIVSIMLPEIQATSAEMAAPVLGGALRTSVGPAGQVVREIVPGAAANVAGGAVGGGMLGAAMAPEDRVAGATTGGVLGAAGALPLEEMARRGGKVGEKARGLADAIKKEARTSEAEDVTIEPAETPAPKKGPPPEEPASSAAPEPPPTPPAPAPTKLGKLKEKVRTTLAPKDELDVIAGETGQTRAEVEQAQENFDAHVESLKKPTLGTRANKKTMPSTDPLGEAHARLATVEGGIAQIRARGDEVPDYLTFAHEKALKDVADLEAAGEKGRAAGEAENAKQQPVAVNPEPVAPSEPAGRLKLGAQDPLTTQLANIERAPSGIAEIDAARAAQRRFTETQTELHRLEDEHRQSEKVYDDAVKAATAHPTQEALAAVDRARRSSMAARDAVTAHEPVHRQAQLEDRQAQRAMRDAEKQAIADLEASQPEEPADRQAPDKAKLVPKRTEDGGVKFVTEPIAPATKLGATKAPPKPVVVYSPEGRMALITPSPREKGKLQASRFHDMAGERPSGHSEHFDEAAARASLARDGYIMDTKPLADAELTEGGQREMAMLRERAGTLVDIAHNGDEWTDEDEAELRDTFARMAELASGTGIATDQLNTKFLASGTPGAQTSQGQEAPDATRSDKQPAPATQRRLGARAASEPEGDAPGDVPRAGAERPTGSAPAGTGGAGGDAVRSDHEGSGDEGTHHVDELPGAGAATGDARIDGEGAGAGRAVAQGSRDRAPDGAGVVPGRNFRITAEVEALIGKGGPVAKRAANLEALKVMRQVTAEGRAATPEEQLILAKYVGWGGLPQAFEEGKDLYSPELKELLTDEEYKAARASTLNAHYTSIPVIRAMYDALAHLGVKGTPRILEPSAGAGHFLGAAGVPAKFTAIELDTVTGRIAQLLYPESDVRVQGFEKAQLPDASIDIAIGNVPFGNFRVSDPRYDKLQLSIHDYFFAKALDVVRPGGIVAMITSRYTMDKRDSAFRTYIERHAHLLGAIRLPDTAFSGNAGTSVVTDIIFLQRRAPDDEHMGAPAWLLTGPINTSIKGLAPDKHNVNSYFLAHPEMVLGEWAKGSMFAGDLTVKAAKNVDVAAALAKAVKNLPANVYTPRRANAPGSPQREAEQFERAPDDVKEGAYTVQDGTLHQRQEGNLVPIPKGPSLDRLTQLTGMKTAVRDLLRLESEGAEDDAIAAGRARLNTLYDKFAKAHGPINKEERTVTARVLQNGEHLETVRYPNRKGFTEDPDWHLVAAIERYDGATGKAEKADILRHRMLEPRKPVESVDSPVHALPIALDVTGKVDLAFIARLSRSSIEDVKAALRGSIYENPETNQWEPADQYLSGPVRDKLKIAQSAAKKDARWKENVEALEQVQPEDLKPSQINIELGAPWVPTSDVEQFIHNLLGSSAQVAHVGALAEWKLTVQGWARGSAAATAQWGTRRADGYTLLEDALNGRLTTVSDPNPLDPTKRVKNANETLAAQEKQQAIKDEFAKWVWKDVARGERLARYYNDHFNNLRVRRFDAHVPQPDGSKQPLLSLPGLAAYRRGKTFTLRAHQINAIWRALQTGNTLLAHQVGAGKTYTMAAIAMESKRLGLAKKPLVAVPNHMLDQFRREFQEAYPGARLLVATPEDFAKEKRKAFVARAAAEDWDAIIMTHRSFEAVPMSAEFQQAHIEQDLVRLEDSIREAKKAKGDTRSLVKIIEKAKKRKEAKLEKLLAGKKKDDLIPFEQMGVDMLMVDEIHLFKNLEFDTKMQGISAPSSERAYDLLLKTKYLEQINPGRGLIGATGTPVANSMAELYTMQRYFAPKMLIERGIEHFDAWASQFGRAVTTLELAPDGSGYRMGTRFAKFVNVPELVQMFRTFADVLTEKDLNLPKPSMIGGKPRNIAVPGTALLRAYVADLVRRADAVKKRLVEPDEDNFLKITGDGRYAATDMRLVDASAPDTPDSKLSQAAERILSTYHDTTPLKGVQLVFSDIGTPSSDGKPKPSSRGGLFGFTVYDEMKRKLVEGGIPAKEIAFMHDADSDVKKAKLFDRVREGAVRVLLGSTEKMGAGTNVQDRLVALHHLDAPCRPSDVEQREGRILRQGNVLYDAKQIPGVTITRYATEGSFDAYMWQGLERKALFIRQVMEGDLSIREMEDLDGAPLGAAEMKALASGNPLVMEKAGIDQEVAKLERLARAHVDNLFSLRQEVNRLPHQVTDLTERLEAFQADAERRVDVRGDKFTITIAGKTYTKRADAGEALKRQLDAFLETVRRQVNGSDPLTRPIGEFGGFPVQLAQNPGFTTNCELEVKGAAVYGRTVEMDATPASLIAGLEALLGYPESKAATTQGHLDQINKRLSEMSALVNEPYEHAEKLTKLKVRQAEVNTKLQESTKKDAPPPASSHADDEDEGDEGGAGGSGVALYSGLPVTAFVAEIKKYLAARRKARAAIVPAPLPDVEQRWQKAKGLVPPSLGERFAAATEGLREMARHFPALDPSASPLHSRVNELLLEVEHGKHYAETVAADAIADIVKGLTPAELDLMTRKMVLDDILKDVDAGLYVGKEIPFGYPDRGAVASHLADVEQEIGRNRQVAAAINRRQVMARAVTQGLVDAERLSADVLNDPRYYHRQVLAYFNTMHPQYSGLSSRDARVKRKGFQKARVGGGDFNTHYVEAEFEWLSQAHRQLHTVAVLEQVQRLADQRPALEAQAKAANEKDYMQRLAQQQRPDPRDAWRQKIAMSTGQLQKLALKGLLSPTIVARFSSMLADLAAEYAAYRAQPRQPRGAGPKAPFRFSHPQWFPFLTAVLNEGGAGASWAGTIYKAMAEIDRAVKDLLGDDFRTWQSLVPDGWTVWQPMEGTQFYKALTIPEYMIEAILKGQKVLDRAMLKEAMVAGGPREQWVVPDGVAATLDKLGTTPDENIIGKAFRATTNTWKVWQLLSPLRALKFNLNNQVGDMDVANTSPGIYRYSVQAAKDLKTYLLDGAGTPALRAEMQDMVRRRVIGSGFSVNEIPDIGKHSTFRRFGEHTGPLGHVTAAYWDRARALTNYRESILRLAAYRYFLAEGAKGLKLSASNPTVIANISDPKDRAAKLSRDLIGDYGNISSGGQWLRGHIMPFYSWFELNAKRYFNLFRNLAHAEGPVRTKKRGFGAIVASAAGRTTLLTLKTLIVIGAVNAWNHSVFPREEAELGDNRTHMQLILGRHADGTVRTSRVQGAVSDLLEIVGMQHPVTDITAIREGRKDWTDQAVQMAEAPANKFLAMWEPVTKTGAELLMGQTLYPDAFHRRPIRDKAEYAARQWQLDWLYRRVTDKPIRPGGITDHALSLLTYATDPGEAAYYRIQDAKRAWLEKNAKESALSLPTALQNALYYHKQALKYGDEDKAERWLERYYDLGGTPASARMSVKTSEPLGGMSAIERRAFRDSLSPLELDALEQAEDWYREMVKEPARDARSVVPPPERRRLGTQ